MWTDEQIATFNKLAEQSERIAQEKIELLRNAIVQLDRLEARIKELQQENLRLRAAQAPSVLQ